MVDDKQPLWTMTRSEFLSFLQQAIVGCEGALHDNTRKTCSGTKELAAHLSCCESTIYALRRDGVLDEAVVSQIGRRIVYDIERARELANNYLEHTRKYNRP